MRGVAHSHISISFVQLGYSVTVEMELGSELHPLQQVIKISQNHDGGFYDHCPIASVFVYS